MNMKNLMLFILFSVFVICGFSQEDVSKSGWNFGALPTITFDTDLGFQYGALVDLVNYGNGERYPNYDHHLYFEVSRYTKGSGINRFYYDSDKLFKGLLTFFDVSYLSDQAYDFYGFNGYDAIYKPEWVDEQNNDYITRMYYKYDRKMFRLKVDLQGNLSGDKLRWAGGINMLNFKIGSVNLDKLNKGKKGDDVLPDVPGLFEKYQDWSIIPNEEANGGFLPLFNAGLVFDTRDHRPNPMKGIWTEIAFEGAPVFLGAESSFLKISLTHRQYFTIIPKNLSLAYRLNYQTTVAGHAPFYYQTQVITSELKTVTSEGLGGFTTLRGILRNRVVGDGYFLGNVEARWKFARFRFMNNNFYLGLNGFLDFGKVTKKIDVKPINFSLPLEQGYFDYGAEKMHYSYGAGLRIAMNENFIIRADYGMAADKRDGTSGMYIGLNYLF
jgi:outer membrane protein assembly factor BamA